MKIADIKAVIANLEIILANREYITGNCKDINELILDGLKPSKASWENRDHTFDCYDGLCNNANLWLVDHCAMYSKDDDIIRFGFEHPSTSGLSSNGTCTLVDHLGHTFIASLPADYPREGRISCVNPVPHVVGSATWENPYRWDYVIHCLNFLENFLENLEK